MDKKKKTIFRITTSTLLLILLVLILVQPNGYAMNKDAQLLWIEASQNYYNSNFTLSRKLFEDIYSKYPKIKNKHFLLNLIAVYGCLSMQPEQKITIKKLLHYHGYDKKIVDYITALNHGSLSEFTDMLFISRFYKYILMVLFLFLYAITLRTILFKKHFPYVCYIIFVVSIVIVYLYWNYPSFFNNEGITLEEIKVYDFPLEEAQKYFSVPSSTFIYILNETPFFYRIQTKIGKEGWVEKTKITRVYND